MLYGKKLTSAFYENFANIDTFLLLEGVINARQQFYENLKFVQYILIS